MKLFAYQVSGVPVSDLDQWSSDDLAGNTAFIIGSGSTPSGYADISSIESWGKWYNGANKDYKYARMRMIEVAYSQGKKSDGGPSGWNGFTSDEKQILAQNFCVPSGYRLQIYPVEVQIQYGLLFHQKSIKARQTRFFYASMEVYNRLPKWEADEIVSEIKNDNLAEQYVQYGREGTVVGDPEGLYDYIMATSGTSYENTGVAKKNLHPHGMTQDQFIDKCKDIIVNGNY